MDELLTVAEVAELLKLNQQTVRNMIDRREIAAVRLGRRRVRIRQSALEAFVAAGEMPAAEDNGHPEPTAENAEARALLGAGLAESTAALADADDQALASALIELADAARLLPRGRRDLPQLDDLTSRLLPLSGVSWQRHPRRRRSLAALAA